MQPTDAWEKIKSKAKNLAYQVGDMAECAHEPLAHCGAIQNFGRALIVEADSLQVVAISENWFADEPGQSSASLLGQSLSEVLKFTKAIDTESLERWCEAGSLERSGEASLKNAICHRQGSHIILEFESVDRSENESSVTLIKELAMQIKTADTLDNSCLVVANLSRAFSDYDRVMVYRFDTEWNGEVIAESRQPNLEPFLNLKYPASDIPPQARDLYYRNSSRVIADARSGAVRLLSKTLEPRDVDLSMSLLRAVSPFHLQYLENLGVRATFSVPIIINDKLWGLIACHRYGQPCRPNQNIRSAFELAAQILAGKVGELVERRRLQIKNETLIFTQTLLNNIAQGKDMVTSFEESSDRLLALTSSTSAFVRIGLRQIFIGKTVRPQTLEALQKRLKEQDTLAVWDSDCLKERLSLANSDPQAAGAMAVPLSLGFQDLLIWFRAEEIHEVNWGGKPKEDKGRESVVHQLTPRDSFAQWTENVRDHSRPWNDADAECAQYFLFGFVHEIFARAHALSLAYKELERGAKAKDEFISTISHELRTPLSVIIGWVDILKDYPQQHNEAKKAIEIIERNARIQVNLIDDLLDVSRIISGKIRIEPQAKVSLNTIVASAVEGIRPAVMARGLTLKWDSQEPVILSADPDRMRQVIWNLLSNALKFTPRGGVIEIKAEVQNAMAVVEVKDSGMGIEPSALGSIFDRFVQENVAFGKSGGLGLGLSIVKGLVELHGGQVRAFSEGRNRGARFEIKLPIYALAAAPETTPLVQEFFPAIRKSDQFKGLHFLIAEDQEESLLALKMLCEQHGAIVHTATDGKRALEMLSARPFDLILSDVGMPEMTGYEFMRAWRSEELKRGLKRIPAVALTAYASSQDRTKALESGFFSHIPKPVDRKELLAVIHSLNLVAGNGHEPA